MVPRLRSARRRCSAKAGNIRRRDCSLVHHMTSVQDIRIFYRAADLMWNKRHGIMYAVGGSSQAGRVAGHSRKKRLLGLLPQALKLKTARPCSRAVFRRRARLGAYLSPCSRRSGVGLFFAEERLDVVSMQPAARGVRRAGRGSRCRLRASRRRGCCNSALRSLTFGRRVRLCSLK